MPRILICLLLFKSNFLYFINVKNYISVLVLVFQYFFTSSYSIFMILPNFVSIGFFLIFFKGFENTTFLTIQQKNPFQV